MSILGDNMAKSCTSKSTVIGQLFIMTAVHEYFPARTDVARITMHCLKTIFFTIHKVSTLAFDWLGAKLFGRIRMV